MLSHATAIFWPHLTCFNWDAAGYIDVATNGEAVPVEISPRQNSSVDVAAWVDLFVREMSSASDIDDAHDRASRSIELFEKSIYECITAESSGLRQENLIMKEQLQALIKENSFLI